MGLLSSSLPDHSTILHTVSRIIYHNKMHLTMSKHRNKIVATCTAYIKSEFRLTHVVFRSPISSLTLFSLFMRVRTRARPFSESLRASLAVRSTAPAVV